MKNTSSSSITDTVGVSNIPPAGDGVAGVAGAEETSGIGDKKATGVDTTARETAMGDPEWETNGESAGLDETNSSRLVT